MGVDPLLIAAVVVGGSIGVWLNRKHFTSGWRDVLMGMLELAPRATYPAHKHPAPELYYVMSGTADWTVGGETFAAGPGTAIYHPPNTPHRMVNTGDEVLRTVYM